MSSAHFHQLWDFFMSNVNQHNSDERQGMFEEAKTALTNIVSRSKFAETTADVSDIELVVGERMFQTGAARCVFTKFDVNDVGKLTPEQFQRSIAEIDVHLTLNEVMAVVAQHDTDNSGSINYDSFIAAIISKRQSQSQTPESIARIQEMVKHRTRRAANNESAAPIDRPPSCGGDQPAVVQVLVKMNNMNLRKVFKDMDSDNDGLVSTEELAGGLISHGLTPVVANSLQFKEYVESYCKRKKGHFGYAEFVRFVNNRLSGQNTKITGEPLSGTQQTHQVDPTLSLRDLVTLINNNTRNMSVSSVLKTYDGDDDGLLSEGEFAQGMEALGFVMAQQQLAGLFAAFDHDHNGLLDLFEVGRSIANPNRNAKLGVVNYRHAPGGESSVALGGGQDDGGANIEGPARTTKPVGGTASVDFSEEHLPTPANAPVRNTNTYHSSHTFSDETLPGDQTGRSGVATREQGPTHRSTIDFAGDHGAESHDHPSVRTAQSKTTLELAHDGNASASSNTAGRANILASPSNKSTISFADNKRVKGGEARKISTPAGGRSVVSFSQDDRDIVRPTTRVLATPGGDDNVDLTMDYAAASDLSSGPMAAVGGTSQVKLSFDKEAGETGPRPVIANISQSPGGNSTVKLAHEKEPAAVQPLGAGHLRAISDAIYNKGRLRHTFQEFNLDQSGSTLSKKDLQIGLANLKVQVPDAEMDAIYARFDKDGDGSLTYSEFVRLLATKS